MRTFSNDYIFEYIFRRIRKNITSNRKSFRLHISSKRRILDQVDSLLLYIRNLLL